MSFSSLLRAEWTKFRSVRSWLVCGVLVALLLVLFGWLTAAGSRSTYNNGPGTPEIVGHPPVPIGPDGGAVSDRFTFAYRELTGDGSITARVSSLTGQELSPEGEVRAARELNPWAKAGLIIKADTTQGSTYAAIMVTGGHGVRWQYNFTEDAAGPTGAVSATSPRWLRLTRTGDTITGYASTDGTAWTTVGSARLSGLPATAPAGMFTTTPARITTTQTLGGGGMVVGGRGIATAAFDRVAASGAWSGTTWQRGDVGGPVEPGGPAPVEQSNGVVTVSGSGDIAPDVHGAGAAVERVLIGAFAALVVVAVLGALFVTTEYRRGLIRTTLAASPRRGRVLAAKAVVIGAVMFVVGLVGAGIALPMGARLLRTNGNFVYPVSWVTEVRLVVGTAAVLAVTAVLALAVGTILRRSAGAIAAVVLLVVLPYILASAAVLPAVPSQWLLRVTPAAGFAIQQSLPEYAQVANVYTPAFGFYPLSPWAGFGVLCGYAAVALGVAALVLRRRDV